MSDEPCVYMPKYTAQVGKSNFVFIFPRLSMCSKRKAFLPAVSFFLEFFFLFLHNFRRESLKIEMHEKISLLEQYIFGMAVWYLKFYFISWLMFPIALMLLHSVVLMVKFCTRRMYAQFEHFCIHRLASNANLMLHWAGDFDCVQRSMVWLAQGTQFLENS